MDRPQLYALASLLSAVGIGGYYILAVFGLPDNAEAMAGQLGTIFIRIIIFSFVIELLLGVLESLDSKRLEKDERDRLIEGRAFRYAYYVLLIVAFTVIGHLAFYGLLEGRFESNLFVSLPTTALHILVLGVFTSEIVNAVTRLYFYNKGV